MLAKTKKKKKKKNVKNKKFKKIKLVDGYLTLKFGVNPLDGL